MKIFYLPGKYPFCYYYRGYLPGVYSKQMVVGEFVANGKQSDPAPIIASAKKADVIVMQRPQEREHVKLARTLKVMGKKIIFENDDTYKGIETSKLKMDVQKKMVKGWNDNMEEIMRMSDGVIASTSFLADEYREVNPNVAVLKNCIDPLDRLVCAKNTTGKFRIGFIGSVTSNDDYLHIKEQIRALDDRCDVTIVILGAKYADGRRRIDSEDDYLFWSSIKNIEWHPYVATNEYMLLISKLALDLAVIPREDSYFNRCKSNLKFLEMSLLDIPVIAQGFPDGKSPYQGVDSKYMTIVNDNNMWYDSVVKIKDDYQKYKRLALTARKYVLKNYNIETYAFEWTTKIQELINK